MSDGAKRVLDARMVQEPAPVAVGQVRETLYGVIRRIEVAEERPGFGWVVKALNGDAQAGLYTHERLMAFYPLVVGTISRSPSPPELASAACATPLPDLDAVRTSLDGASRVVVLRSGLVISTDSDLTPTYRQQDILCRWPHDVTTDVERVVLEAASAAGLDVSEDWRLAFELRRSVANGFMRSRGDALHVVQTVLGKKRYGWLPEDLRAELEGWPWPTPSTSPPPTATPPSPVALPAAFRCMTRDELLQAADRAGGGEVAHVVAELLHVRGQRDALQANSTALLERTRRAESRPKVGVSVLVRRPDGSLLLGLRKGSHGEGTWGAPGGHLEADETVAECAARELAEETGIDVHPSAMSVLGVYTHDRFPKEWGTYITAWCVLDLQFSATPAEVCEPEKCAEWRWVRPGAGWPGPLFRCFQSLIDGGYGPHTVKPAPTPDTLQSELGRVRTSLAAVEAHRDDLDRIAMKRLRTISAQRKQLAALNGAIRWHVRRCAQVVAGLALGRSDATPTVAP